MSCTLNKNKIRASELVNAIKGSIMSGGMRCMIAGEFWGTGETRTRRMKYPAGFLRPLNRRDPAAGRLIGPAGLRWLPRAH